ncbi:MAG TPA: SGNH/GDSL hydrolase family protein, partial [Pirellulaceae bacterium]|nr:SGNH/GDSL hydrolase family protein [Pirellulaceae bacterium]
MRFAFLAVSFVSVCLVAPLFGAESLDPAQAKEENGALWYDVRLLTVEGQGWSAADLKAPYDRLPAKAEGKVRDAVWGLSRDSAGLCIRFRTDSPTIQCRWTLTKSNLAMPHMAATGVSGVDLYVNVDGWRWLATGRPTSQLNSAALVSNLPAGKRAYVLYLPLYNGVSSVEIGIANGSDLEALPRDEKRAKPIVFWGTSITQGGCASRTGMVHTAIL